VHESSRKALRLDRRLIGRRGWTRPEELEQELAGLPDVADKAELVDSPTPAKPGGGEGSPQGG